MVCCSHNVTAKLRNHLSPPGIVLFHATLESPSSIRYQLLKGKYSLWDTVRPMHAMRLLFNNAHRWLPRWCFSNNPIVSATCCDLFLWKLEAKLRYFTDSLLHRLSTLFYLHCFSWYYIPVSAPRRPLLCQKGLTQLSFAPSPLLR